MINEQVKKLRDCAHRWQSFENASPSETFKLLSQDADTIEALSAKVAEANMERSERYYEVRKELVEQHNKAFDLINKMPLEGNEVWHGYVGGVMQTLGSLINYMDNRP